MRVGRVLDASDPRVDPKPRKGTRKRVAHDDTPYRPSIDTDVEFDAIAEQEAYKQREAARRASITERLTKQHEKHSPIYTPPPPITDAQEKLIERLLEELKRVNPDVYGVAHDWYRDQRAQGNMDKKLATRTITRLKDQCGYIEGTWNKRPDFVPADREVIVPTNVDHSTPIDYFDDVPDGYYAVRDDDNAEHIIFYRVSTWKRPWKDEARPGRKVQHIVGGDKLYPVNRVAARTILRQIRDADPAKAGKLYADEIGQCSRCNRSLTDEVSREYGKGPTCRNL